MASTQVGEHQTADSSAVATAFTGAVLTLVGRRRGGIWGALMSITGLGLLVRAVTPPILEAVLNAGAKRRALELDLSFLLDRPVHEVFDFCKDFENFPQFVGSLQRVIDYEDGRSHWEAISPAGHAVEWDAVITKYVPHTVIAWQSVPGSTVKSDGSMRFQPTPDGGTSVALRLRYEPLTTRLDDALRAIVAPTREAQLRSDLARARVMFPPKPDELSGL